MIYAIKNNKVNRAIYRGNEDALTSSIFERLSYLPKELMHNIILKALYDVVPNLDVHQIDSIEYWPNWGAEYTSNKRRIEPDIFIQTATQDIIIEAKRYDGKQQSEEQWKREIQGYINEYSDENNNKQLVFIALGGLYTKETTSVKVGGRNYAIYKCKWSGILEAVKAIKYSLEASKHLTNNTIAINNILSDIILCFELFGFSSSEWLERMPKNTNIKNTSINFLAQEWIK